MTSEMFGCVKLFLILSACSHYRCIQVSIPESQYEVARGSDITLPCSFTPARPNYEMFILKWEVVQNNKATIVGTFYSNLNRVDISPNYEGRTSLDVDSSNRMSALHLTKVTMEDNTNFQCTVLIPGDDEGTPSATTSLLILVAPSSPICQIQGKAEYWHNISLTCLSEEGSPIPLYDWKSFSVENTPRPFPPKTTEKDGALSLFNISREMSGFYICTSTNRIGSASCNLTLAVMPGGSMSGATAGIIGGVVGALLLLVILIFCYCRNKNKKAKYTEGSPGEMEFRDGDDAEGLDGYQENKIPNNHDKDINEQIQHREKTGKDELDEDMESTAESSKYRSSQDRLDDYRGRQDRVDDYRGYQDRVDDYRGNQDRVDDYRGNQDRVDDYRGYQDRVDDYRGNQDRVDDYRGSRDRLDDYRGSRDRLDEHHGSRDRLDNYRGSRDHRDDHRGSRDRLDDYRGSRDRLDDHRGNRDRLDDHSGSQDRLNDHRGSRDRLDDGSHRYGSRDHLDSSGRGRYE
ncbi:V-set and immunoglobulin domain-containing protein 2 [Eucyclogobius newberryi]|uniref:V-set and immunoglobulin domain-containing protein 2 n=1 Tax=Eucyclogobius newberryi TaxID=166745 RepID=UPI003B5CED18